MSDRELLELAAKAAGIELMWKQDPEEWAAYVAINPYYHKEWNPLDSDGDALRLAVALKMKITIGNAIVMAEAIGIPDVGVQFTDEPGAATRRAIVRAAAAMEKGPQPVKAGG